MEFRATDNLLLEEYPWGTGDPDQAIIFKKTQKLKLLFRLVTTEGPTEAQPPQMSSGFPFQTRDKLGIDLI